jgi:hypothetical protein
MLDNAIRDLTAQLWDKAKRGDLASWLALQRDWTRRLEKRLTRKFRTLHRLTIETIVTEVLEDICLKLHDFPTWGHAWRYGWKKSYYRALETARYTAATSPPSPETTDPHGTWFLTSLEYTDTMEVLLRQCPDTVKRKALTLIFLNGRLQAEVWPELHLGKSKLQRWVSEFTHQARRLWND